MALSLVLTSCGGGSGASSTGASTPPVAIVPPPPPPFSDTPASTEASRFLAQASFGATTEDIAHLSTVGYNAWITEQFALPPTSHQAVIDEVLKTRRAQPYDFYPSFWKQAAT